MPTSTLTAFDHDISLSYTPDDGAEFTAQSAHITVIAHVDEAGDLYFEDAFPIYAAQWSGLQTYINTILDRSDLYDLASELDLAMDVVYDRDLCADRAYVVPTDQLAEVYAKLHAHCLVHATDYANNEYRGPYTSLLDGSLQTLKTVANETYKLIADLEHAGLDDAIEAVLEQLGGKPEEE